MTDALVIALPVVVLDVLMQDESQRLFNVRPSTSTRNLESTFI